jgi:hypothetical protein
VILALLACAPSPEETLVLTGWRYSWQELSHRVAYLRVGLEDDSSLALGLVGGDWSTGEQFSDAPDYAVRYARVVSPHVTSARGEAAFEVGPEQVADATIEVDAAALGDGELVALLDGFEIDTDVPQPDGYPADYDPGLGYTSNGFGFAVGEPERDGDVVRVPVTATVRWGPQDRADVNAAIPYAVTGVRTRVLVLAVDGEADGVVVAGASDYEHDPPYSDQPPMTQDVLLEGARPEGFVGWRSFDLRANVADGDPDAGEGDYLRAFGVEVEPTAVEKKSWAGTVTTTLSTSSLSEWTALSAAYENELVRIGVLDATVDHWLVEGTIPVGAAKTGPTLSE